MHILFSRRKHARCTAETKRGTQSLVKETWASDSCELMEQVVIVKL